jgi:hypothetical protein
MDVCTAMIRLSFASVAAMTRIDRLTSLVGGLGIAVAASTIGVAAPGCALTYVVPDDVDDDGDACGPSEVACDGTCVETDEDPAHCGRCGNACADDEACVGGECVPPATCDLATCDNACVDTQTDPANCGTCGRWCDSSAECIAGECIATCSESCDGDVELCIDGACECRSGLVRCGDECVDVSSDDDHCGMCGRECDDDGGSPFCRAGTCASDCGALALCDEECIDLASDPLNCGVCDRECHPSQVCVSGECETP